MAVRGANTQWMTYALTLGLVEAELEVHRPRPPVQVAELQPVKELVHEIIREIPGPGTLVVDKPLRSGQKIYARGSDLVFWPW